MRGNQPCLFSSLIARCRLLFLDPVINIFALKSPLAAHLECRQLAVLCHGVDGLFGNLKQLGYLGQCCKISSGMNRSSLGKR